MSASGDRDAWKRVLVASERIDWRLDDVLAEDGAFDFSRPFLPDALTGASRLTFLGEPGRLSLGHIRAHGYLGLFGIVEELILPFVVAHTPTNSLAALDLVRALLRFASEEAKHIELFRRFASVFARGYQKPCALVGPADGFARAVLAHSDLGVALAILHIEWMTQKHWLECVRGDDSLEPAFKQLLRYHWMEEAQHARLDTLLVRQLAAGASVAQREQAIDDYLAIVALMDAVLAQQVELDRQALEARVSRSFSEAQLETFRSEQQRSQRQTFLLSGMSHARFLATASEVSAHAPERIQRATSALL